MNVDRGTLALAVFVCAAALAFGPLVPAVDLPNDDRAGDPLYGGFAADADVGVHHQLSFQVRELPSTATVSRGKEMDSVSVPGATVTVAAGESPVTLRYRLRNGERSWQTTAAVPAGAASNVTRSLNATGPSGSFDGNLTLLVTAATDSNSYVVARTDLEVTESDDR